MNRYGYFRDADNLADPLAFPRFVASRLAYRRFARHLKWLAIPFFLAILLKLPLTLTLLSRTRIGAPLAQWPNRFLLLGGVVVAGPVLGVGAPALAAYPVWGAGGHAAPRPR